MPKTQTLPAEIQLADRKASFATLAALTFTLLGVWGIEYVSQAPGTQLPLDGLSAVFMMSGVNMAIRASVLKSGVAFATMLHEMGDR
jgi:hypothetical protein